MSRKLSYDTWLFAAALLIVVIGLVMIYSASAIITDRCCPPVQPNAIVR